MSRDNDILRSSDLAEWLPKLLPHRFGVTRLSRPISMELYDQWLAEGHHGEMKYLARHRDFKADPAAWLPFAKSAIVFAIDYSKNNYVTPRKTTPRAALYTDYAANKADYHDAIRSELTPILEELLRRYPEAQFRFALDAEPVLERDLAARAGLGWVGKNTCIIDRQSGSLFFIAEILTSLETSEATLQMQDFCGTCTRCLDACPTEALIAPRKLDATKCISYWTIESKTVPPPELRTKFDDWFFGCDICQTVCPWNGKVFGRERMEIESRRRAAATDEDKRQLTFELKRILESSNRSLQKDFRGTPFERAGGFGLKRNALIVAGNMKLEELLPEVNALKADPKLGPLAVDTAKLLV